MTIAPYVDNAEENREIFRELKKLSVDIAAKNINNVTMSVLSMGMTGDYMVAVQEGATMVRVGLSLIHIQMCIRDSYRHRRKYKAEDGQEGGKKRCHGADGKDVVLKVPEGTVIMDAESGKVIADMSGENRRQVVLKGGRGGKGNQHYATATMQVPKYAQPGQPAQELEVLLELKVIADVGLVGFPNVGKSTFLSRVTNAQPKICLLYTSRCV